MVLVFGSGSVTTLIKEIVTSNAKPWLSNAMVNFLTWINSATSKMKMNSKMKMTLKMKMALKMKMTTKITLHPLFSPPPLMKNYLIFHL